MRCLFIAIAFPVLLGIALIAMPLSPKSILDPLGMYMIQKFEQNQLPDVISRLGTRVLLGLDLRNDRAKQGPRGSEQERAFLQNFTADLRTRDIAEFTTAANEQHYEGELQYPCTL